MKKLAKAMELAGAKSFVSVGCPVGWKVGLAWGQRPAPFANEKCWAVLLISSAFFWRFCRLVNITLDLFSRPASIEDAFKQKEKMIVQECLLYDRLTECWCKIRSLEKRG
jgi:hypothetical protein